MKVKYQAQEREHGCALACLAMVLDRKQSDIEREFYTDFNRKGIPPSVIKDYFVDHGLSVIEKKSESSHDRIKSNQRMLEPFAPVHVVTFQSVPDKKQNHAVVMDRKGRIFDPGRKECKDGSDFYYVISVLGIYRD